MASGFSRIVSGGPREGEEKKEQPAVKIPATQKAAVKAGLTAPITEVPVQKLKPGQMLVKINWTGLCHSDIAFLRDYWPDSPVQTLVKTMALGITGHEGAGTVVALAPDVAAQDQWSIGDRAGIKWCASVCRRCEFCTNGVDELHCAKQLNSGLTTPGTFQQYVATDALYATRLPEAVSDEEAGPLMCGGITAYVACKRSGVKPGQWLVNLGAGGGLGHVRDICRSLPDPCLLTLLYELQLGLQYAKAMGMRSIAVDVGPEKEELCKKLGAEVYIDALKCEDLADEVMKTTTYGGTYLTRRTLAALDLMLTSVGIAHGAIVFAPTKQAYEAAPRLLRPGGTMVAVGLPKDPTIVAGAPPTLVVMKKVCSYSFGVLVFGLKAILTSGNAAQYRGQCDGHAEGG